MDLCICSFQFAQLAPSSLMKKEQIASYGKPTAQLIEQSSTCKAFYFGTITQYMDNIDTSCSGESNLGCELLWVREKLAVERCRVKVDQD